LKGCFCLQTVRGNERQRIFATIETGFTAWNASNTIGNTGNAISFNAYILMSNNVPPSAGDDENAAIEDSPKNSSEGHGHRFASMFK
jgi:hypothetical protein